jgi:hypothetical protein
VVSSVSHTQRAVAIGAAGAAAAALLLGGSASAALASGASLPRVQCPHFILVRANGSPRILVRTPVHRHATSRCRLRPIEEPVGVINV